VGAELTRGTRLEARLKSRNERRNPCAKEGEHRDIRPQFLTDSANPGVLRGHEKLSGPDLVCSTGASERESSLSNQTKGGGKGASTFNWGLRFCIYSIPGEILRTLDRQTTGRPWVKTERNRSQKFGVTGITEIQHELENCPILTGKKSRTYGKA